MYFNLPKIKAMVEESGFIQGMFDSKPEAKQVGALFLSQEFTSMGFGSTSVEVDGGTRTTSFGPSAFSGGAASAGIVAAIAVPNLLNAIDRGKQKRTMADIRSAATAIESYSIDNNIYPGPTDGWVTAKGIETALEPIYIRTLPEKDGWGHDLLFLSDGERYVIVSPGKDGNLDRDYSDGTGPGATANFNADIVFANGQFVAWPEGTQQ
jgi:general secretion pathway protein G